MHKKVLLDSDILTLGHVYCLITRVLITTWCVVLSHGKRLVIVSAACNNLHMIFVAA